MLFAPGEIVTLPIGLDWKGSRYRQVHIDQMRGHDDKAIASKRVKNNGSRAMSIILQRCIQCVEGLVDSKADRNSLIDERYVRALYQPDRDYLFMAIQALSMETDQVFDLECPVCQTQNQITVAIPTLSVQEWDLPGPPKVEIALLKMPRPTILGGKEITEIEWRYMTGAGQEELAALSKNELLSKTLELCVFVPALDRFLTSAEADDLPTKQRLHLASKSTEASPGVDMTFEVMCCNSDCAHEWLGAVDIGRFFNGLSPENSKGSKHGSAMRNSQKKR